MKAPGSTSPQAAALACGLHSPEPDVGGRWQERTTRLYRIAELMGRYKPEHDTATGKWHLWDAETHRRLDVEYRDEATARAGARLAAAIDIDELYQEPVSR